MVNSQVQKETNFALKIDERVEKTPSAIPVIEVGIKGSKNISIVESGTATNATSTTIYTTPTDQDFYLTFASLHVNNADAAGTSTLIQLTIVVNSVRKAILSQVARVSTNHSGRAASIFQSDRHPIKVDRGSTITLTLNATSASDLAVANIAGYIDEIA